MGGNTQLPMVDSRVRRITSCVDDDYRGDGGSWNRQRTGCSRKDTVAPDHADIGKRAQPAWNQCVPETATVKVVQLRYDVLILKRSLYHSGRVVEHRLKATKLGCRKPCESCIAIIEALWTTGCVILRCFVLLWMQCVIDGELLTWRMCGTVDSPCVRSWILTLFYHRRYECYYSAVVQSRHQGLAVRAVTFNCFTVIFQILSLISRLSPDGYIHSDQW